MADDSTMRTCRKTACRWPAAASLSFRYDTRQVWLLDLSGAPDPSLYDLCPPHADALVVPQGWVRVDQRTHAQPVAEPAGRDLVRAAAPTRHRVSVGAGYARSRYEELSRDLPRLARELAGRDHPEHDEDDARRRGDPPALAAVRPVEEDARDDAAAEGGPLGGTEESDVGEQVAAGEEVAAGQEVDARGQAEGSAQTETAPAPRVPVPSRDLAPVPPSDQLPGQLAIPVSEEEGEDAVGEAVVVSIELAGSRRRTADDDGGPAPA